MFQTSLEFVCIIHMEGLADSTHPNNASLAFLHAILWAN